MSPISRELAALKKYLLGDELRLSPKRTRVAQERQLLVLRYGVVQRVAQRAGTRATHRAGFAAIFGEDIIKFMNCPDATLEDLLANIRAFHFRVIEQCHMINRLDGCPDNTEENFLFGMTCFLTEAKIVVTHMFTERLFQTASERLPLILIGEGLYDEIKLVRKNYGVDTHNTDIIDMIESRYIALDAGTLGPTHIKDLKLLTQGFGLGTAESWYPHNTDNYAAMTLIVALLAGLNDTPHPFAPSEGYPPRTVAGRKIQDNVRAAADRIKSRSTQKDNVVKYCHRCEVPGHMPADCFATIAACNQCGSDQHNTHRCLHSVTKTREAANDKMSMGGA